jgi:hypothetical protein
MSLPLVIVYHAPTSKPEVKRRFTSMRTPSSLARNLPARSVAVTPWLMR